MPMEKLFYKKKESKILPNWIFPISTVGCIGSKFQTIQKHILRKWLSLKNDPYFLNKVLDNFNVIFVNSSDKFNKKTINRNTDPVTALLMEISIT